MEEKIEEKIELYCKIYEELHERVSESNLENAGEIALRMFEEIAKDLRSEQIARWRSEGKISGDARSNEELATQRQREALERFGIKKIPENLSIREASAILNKLNNLSREQDREAIDRVIEELNRDWYE